MIYGLDALLMRIIKLERQLQKANDAIKALQEFAKAYHVVAYSGNQPFTDRHPPPEIQFVDVDGNRLMVVRDPDNANWYYLGWCGRDDKPTELIGKRPKSPTNPCRDHIHATIVNTIAARCKVNGYVGSCRYAEYEDLFYWTNKLDAVEVLRACTNEIFQKYPMT